MIDTGSRPHSSCLQTLFEAQIDRGPDRVAVTCAGQALTYRALDARANQLARRLRGLGVGPDTLVAVSVERSLDLVVALVGVLKAGGAYLPIDPDHPVERLRFHLEDSRARVLVTRQSLSPAIPGGLARVLLDADAEEISACSPERLPASTSSSHLAYVIYTSGSTGRPKGVEITHANVARLFSTTQPLFGFGPEDVWSACHSAAFDFSVWELFGALLHGGRVVVVTQEIVREPRQLATLLSAERVTMLSQTPSAFRQLMPALLAMGEPPPLRSIVFGGEALEPGMLRPWIERFGDERPGLVNMYGITETTVHATYRRITSADVAAPRGSVIGRPLPDLDIVLLDAQQRPVADGEVGEIHVVGSGVGRGYLGRPDLTAERFVALPDGRRAYRSGDLARALPDGDLVYLGRVDRQVKIRGHRVELGEIQSRLLDSPGVADAAIVCRRDGDDDALVAYVVPQAGQRLSASLLRAELARHVPFYMVPSAVELLERLPLTVNGKLDEVALPSPRRAQPEHRPPASRTEQALCRCVAEALGLEHVGLDDRFVALGGHSLRAAQVTRDLEVEIGLVIPIGALLSNRSVAELAAQLDAPMASMPAAELSRTSAPRTAEALASAAQLGLWLHAQRRPRDPAYNETLTLVVPGAVEVARLEQCLAEIVARHDSLRTTFTWRSGALHQRVAPSAFVPLIVEDVRALPRDERAPAAQRLAEAAARIPFDLSTPPLLRVLVVQLGEREHRLYLTLHHAVCDAPSLHNLAVELSALYDARSRGQSLRLPPLPIQYADVVTGSDGSGMPAPLSATSPTLPVDFARAAEVPSDGARHPVRIPPPLAGSLRAIGAAEGATLFMVLLAAWHALLHRYSGSDETCVGTVAAQRARAEHATIIGPLVTVLQVTARPRRDQPFTALLAEVRAGLLATLDTGAREPAVAASPETGFGVLPPPPRLAGDWEPRLLDVGSGAAKHDLLVLLQEDEGGGLIGFIEYRTALRLADTMARMAGHFVQLLASIAAEPSLRLGELVMLSEAERQELLSWGRGDTVEAPAACAHELFLNRVRRSPDTIAIELDTGAFSYGQLAARATAIAAQLGARGVCPESLIAVCLERSFDLVAALLGVHMAGGAFLPLDPEQPVGRLAQLCADARPALVLTTSALRACVEGCAGALLCLDEERLPEPPALFAAVRPHHLAYVLHTSGSTGQPKAVQIEHRSLSNLTAIAQRAFELGPGSRLLQLARVTFDVAIMEIFCALAAGATLVLPRGADVLIGAELLQLIRERAITVAVLPASLLATLPAAELPALATLAIGGEACAPEVVDRWAGGRRFLNAYGPTEATVGATLARCEPGQGKPPIGRPLDNIEVHALDVDRQLVPIGVPGELYIGGVGVARGYLNEPELTSARFVESPLRPGERLYRTGDLVRWRPDGQLDFLGRIDRQLKLRGFRIEPAEIEAALREHPAVHDAVVVAREDVPGHRNLCAYVTVRELCAELSVEEDLLRFLRRRLPAYLIPSAVVRLAALPLTPNGKLDLASLPPPRAARALPPTGASQAEDTMEARIVAVWGEVLGIQQIGHGESFFDLGGTSLLLVQVQERLEAVLGGAIPTPVLFQHPTPRALAERLRGGAEAGLADEAASRARRFREVLTARRRQQRRPDHG